MKPVVQPAAGTRASAGGIDAGCDSRSALQKMAAHAQLVEPGVRRTDGQGKTEHGVDQRDHIQVLPAGVEPPQRPLRRAETS
jgi:hypothetical protein